MDKGGSKCNSSYRSGSGTDFMTVRSHKIHIFSPFYTNKYVFSLVLSGNRRRGRRTLVTRVKIHWDRLKIWGSLNHPLDTSESYLSDVVSP
jgi:hypothetical protein